jgi:hypothetical protein
MCLGAVEPCLFLTSFVLFGIVPAAVRNISHYSSEHGQMLQGFAK